MCFKNLFVNLRSPRDCLWVADRIGVRPSVCPPVAAVWIDQLRAASIHLLLLGKCYSVHINASSL